MTIEGGCRCGATRYSLAIDATPPVYCCHCLDCQSWSRSAFSQQAVVREDTILIAGPVTEFHFQSSGSQSYQRLCGVCHARIYNTNSARPGIAVERAGTLDASDTLVPRAHIRVRRKQPWAVIANDVPTFDEAAPPAAFAAILLRPTP